MGRTGSLPTHTLKKVNHSCLSCLPGPDRVVDRQAKVVNLPTHFRGPPTSGNGGVAAGLYPCLGAEALPDDVVQLHVRLHKPIPLNTDLDFQIGEPENSKVDVSVTHDNAAVLSGWVSSVSQEPLMTDETLSELRSHSVLSSRQQLRFDQYVEVPGPSSADFAECFVCGPDARRGLRLRLRPVTDEIFWKDWHPDQRWEDKGLLASLPAIAALDCTSAAGFHLNGILEQDESCLLGTYDAQLGPAAPINNSDGLRIISKTRDRDGRKIFTDIGLFSPNGAAHVLGKATWIVVSPEDAKGS